MNTLGVSPLTLQRALDRLEQEGFVRSIDRVGSFVASNPPHLSRYPLIFISSPNSPFGGWTRFWQILSTSAAEAATRAGMQIPIYTGIDGHADNEDYLSLLGDIEYGRLAGLIFTQHPGLLRDTPLLTTPGIPRVAISRSIDYMAVVTHDFASFFSRSAQYLASVGCRKVAVILTPGQRPGSASNIEAVLESAGLSVRPEWIQVMAGPESCKTVLQLLMSGNTRERPDGLILADDNFMEHGAAGLAAAGVRVPDDLHVVTHCNFPPMPEPNVTRFVRLGWDVREMLAACLEILEAQREGDADPQSQRLMPARFEDELRLPAAGRQKGGRAPPGE